MAGGHGRRAALVAVIDEHSAVSDYSFFWHDYETFGLDTRRDRPAQFAGVRSDAELNELAAPVMAFCQPAPDYLPDPQSCLITGITPQQALHQGIPEHAFAALVERELSQPGSIGVGYNSIRFDDEVTRHLFWRNLIDPYAREWQNGCGRWDLLDVVRAAWALRPQGLQWPVGEDGKPSFRLELLTRANGLAHESAHDALSDVRATLALARAVRQAQPRLWDFCLRLRKKDAVMAEIGAGRPFLHLSGRYPVERGCMAIVLPLASHPRNKNELIVWDLAHPLTELQALNVAQARERMFVRTEELPPGVQRLPIKTIHLNRSPMVVANLNTLTSEVRARFAIDVDQARRHAEQAANLLLSLDWAGVFERPDSGQSVDVDEDLYGGFLGNGDRRALSQLRALKPGDLARRVSEGRVAFDDPRLDELLFRYRARNHSATLDGDEQARWQHHCRDRLHEGLGGALNLATFQDRVDALCEQADERGQDVLGALLDYAQSIAP